MNVWYGKRADNLGASAARGRWVVLGGSPRDFLFTLIFSPILPQHLEPPFVSGVHVVRTKWVMWRLLSSCGLFRLDHFDDLGLICVTTSTIACSKRSDSGETPLPTIWTPGTGYKHKGKRSPPFWHPQSLMGYLGEVWRSRPTLYSKQVWSQVECMIQNKR